jgi:hypothetical protein
VITRYPTHFKLGHDVSGGGSPESNQSNGAEVFYVMYMYIHVPSLNSSGVQDIGVVGGDL